MCSDRQAALYIKMSYQAQTSIKSCPHIVGTDLSQFYLVVKAILVSYYWTDMSYYHPTLMTKTPGVQRRQLEMFYRSIHKIFRMPS